MSGRFNIYKWLDRDKFTEYKTRENSFNRLGPLYLVFALIVAPIFSVLTYNTSVPVEYFYISISFSIGFVLYVGICWMIKALNDKLLFFFLAHIFGATVYAFLVLYRTNFDTLHLFSFLSVYALFSLAIQRLYPLFLYNILVLILTIYGLYTIPELSVPISKKVIAAFFILIGMSSTFMIYSRQVLVNSIEDYSNYLKDILDDPVMGYILLSLGKKVDLMDINNELRKTLFKDSPSIINETRTWFSKEEMEKVDRLKIGQSFFKQIEKVIDGRNKTFELKISILPLKNGDSLLIRFYDITSIVEKQKELELSESRYKKLYHRNRAGVFTVNKDSQIIDANPAFYEIFDQTIAKQDKLINNKDEWSFIKDSVSGGETLKNYQTAYELNNGEIKTLVFSWYKDEQTENYEGSIVDLTTFEKASQALKQSEEKYRLIFEESNDAIILMDGDLIINANQKAHKLFPDILNKKLFDYSFDNSEEAERTYYKYKSRLANQRTVKFNWLFNNEPNKIEAEVAFTEIILEDKVYYQCVIHDQTEFNSILRNIESNRKNFENILNNSPDGILITRDKNVLYMNPELRKMYKKNVEFSDLFQGKDKQRFNRLYEKFHESGDKQNAQLNLQIEEGVLEVDITIVPTQYQEQDAALILIKDVSVQNALSKEKARAELAEETNKQLEAEISERVKAQRLLQEQYLRTKAILESSSNTFLLTLLPDKKVSAFNTHFKNYFLHISGEEINEGTDFNQFIKTLLTPIELRFFNKVLNKVISGKQKNLEVQLQINGRQYWLEIYMSPIFDTNGSVSEISLVAHDVSEKKKASIEIEESLKEKEILLREIHHRVKNNLQVISSILNLQSSYVSDEETLKILQESRNRIRSMAIIHENLYRRDDFSSINFAVYLDNLTKNLISSYGINQRVDLIEDIDDVNIDLDQAIPCGLLVNELITNSLKYAWDDGQEGKIFITLKKKDKYIYLEVGDNGKGLPADFNDIKSDTLGLQLVITLVEQLDGELQVEVKNGTKYLIKFEDIKPNSHVKD